MNETATPTAADPPRLSRAHLSVLAEPILFLEARSEQLIGKWSGLYLSAFGRGSFFSPERVEKIFREIAEFFIASLKKADFDAYFKMLEAKGRLFSEIGVPFEEILLCLQLFEEAYLSLILENKKAVRHGPDEILLAFEELRHLSAFVFTESYFRTMKKNWQNTCRGHQEENERLRRELESLRDEYLSATRGELASMELLIRGINQKLRKSVVQSRQVQRFAEFLDREGEPSGVLRAAEKFLKRLLPEGSLLLFALFDENRRKLLVSSPGAPYPDFAPLGAEEAFLSQLARNLQESLFDEAALPVAFSDPSWLGPSLARHPALATASDFLFLPLRRSPETLGFLLFAAPEKDVFTRGGLKLYARFARVLARSYFGVLYFSRQKKNLEFASVLIELDERVLQRNPLESTLDFCLGSLIELLQIERASLMRLDPDRKTLSLYAAKGHRVYPFSGLELKWGEGIAGWCAKEGRIVAIPRMRPERAAPRTDEEAPLPVKSLLCVPVAPPGLPPVGVLNLSTLGRHRTFERSEIDMANQFAHRIHTVLTTLAPAREFEAYVRPHLERP